MVHLRIFDKVSHSDASGVTVYRAAKIHPTGEYEFFVLGWSEQGLVKDDRFVAILKDGVRVTFAEELFSPEFAYATFGAEYLANCVVSGEGDGQFWSLYRADPATVAASFNDLIRGVNPFVQGLEVDVERYQRAAVYLKRGYLPGHAGAMSFGDRNTRFPPFRELTSGNGWELEESLSACARRGRVISPAQHVAIHVKYDFDAQSDLGDTVILGVANPSVANLLRDGQYSKHDLQTALMEFGVKVKGTLRSPVLENISLTGLEGKVADAISTLVGKGKAFEVLDDMGRGGLNESQFSAAQRILGSCIATLSGPPGSGKTFTCKRILEEYQRRGYRVIGLAPVGMAAARLGDVTGVEARTIDSYVFDESETATEKTLFAIDEMSLADVLKLSMLFEKTEARGCYLLLGDVYQIPSVGPGAVLRDLLMCDAIAHGVLEGSERIQKSAGALLGAINDIRKGEFPRQGGESFSIQPRQNLAQTLKAIDELVQKFGITYDDVMVMSPVYRGETGVDNLNFHIAKAARRGQKDWFKAYGKMFFLNDKVMCTKTNPSKKISNGSIGKIVRFSVKNGEVAVELNGRIVDLRISDMHAFVPAYAVSMHKCQGSEAKLAICVFPEGSASFVTRQLLFTAASRGRQATRLFASEEDLNTILANDSVYTRNTTLQTQVQRRLEAKRGPITAPIVSERRQVTETNTSSQKSDKTSVERSYRKASDVFR